MSGQKSLRWDCHRQGCWVVFSKAKLEHLSVALPGKTAFTDVDGLVELGGKGLLMEWKSRVEPIPDGQRIAFERLTRSGLLTVLVLVGDPVTMAVAEAAYYLRGAWMPWRPADLAWALWFIRRWSGWARGVPGWRDEPEPQVQAPTPAPALPTPQMDLFDLESGSAIGVLYRAARVPYASICGHRGCTLPPGHIPGHTDR